MGLFQFSSLCLCRAFYTFMCFSSNDFDVMKHHFPLNVFVLLSLPKLEIHATQMLLFHCLCRNMQPTSFFCFLSNIVVLRTLSRLGVSILLILSLDSYISLLNFLKLNMSYARQQGVFVYFICRRYTFRPFKEDVHLIILRHPHHSADSV